MYGDHFIFGGFMWIVWIVIIVGLVFLIKWLVQQGQLTEKKREETALEILKKRYARGEIDRDEFEQKRKDLGG